MDIVVDISKLILVLTIAVILCSCWVKYSRPHYSCNTLLMLGLNILVLTIAVILMSRVLQL
jgi:hypothetical protein